jgi:hypothetical protein
MYPGTECIRWMMDGLIRLDRPENRLLSLALLPPHGISSFIHSSLPSRLVPDHTTTHHVTRDSRISRLPMDKLDGWMDGWVGGGRDEGKPFLVGGQPTQPTNPAKHPTPPPPINQIDPSDSFNSILLPTPKERSACMHACMAPGRVGSVGSMLVEGRQPVMLHYRAGNLR